MPNATRNRSRDEEKLTAEFTTGQLVVAICFFLFFALTCFLLGILVGKYQGYPEQPPERMAAQEAPAQTPAQDTKPENKAPAAPAKAGAQTSPRTDLLPPRRETGAAEAPSRYTPRDQRSGPRVTEMSPLPAPPAPLNPNQPPLRVTRTPAAPTAETTAPPTTAATTAPPAAPPPATEPTPAPTPPLLTPSDPPDTPSPPPAYTPDPELEPAAAAAASAGGLFGIQLAAFVGANRKQQAETYLNMVKQGDAPNAEIMISADGQYHRVVVAGFADREAAQNACAELKKKKNCAEAFVRPIP
jgi:cell division protein FtsN